MSTSSAVTAREQPVRGASSASAGDCFVCGETLVVESRERIEVIDLTGRVVELVRRLNIAEGMVNFCSTHTTCAVFVNEFQAALVADIKHLLESLVSREAPWQHNQPDLSDCDRMNADAHLRTMLLGHSLTLQVSGGEVVLGQWQRILMAELDGPRPRTLRLQAWGIR